MQSEGPLVIASRLTSRPIRLSYDFAEDFDALTVRAPTMAMKLPRSGRGEADGQAPEQPLERGSMNAGKKAIGNLMPPDEQVNHAVVSKAAEDRPLNHCRRAATRREPGTKSGTGGKPSTLSTAIPSARSRTLMLMALAMTSDMLIRIAGTSSAFDAAKHVPIGIEKRADARRRRLALHRPICEIQAMFSMMLADFVERRLVADPHPDQVQALAVERDVLTPLIARTCPTNR